MAEESPALGWEILQVKDAFRMTPSERIQEMQSRVIPVLIIFYPSNPLFLHSSGQAWGGIPNAKVHCSPRTCPERVKELEAWGPDDTFD